MSNNEFAVGLQLGKQLAGINVAPNTPVMLFYDALNKAPDKTRLVMTTHLLEGVEKQLGFLPDLVGAGLLGDHIWTPTQQFLGNKMDDNHAFALIFSDDIYINNIILHGCHPVSPYYMVTKADGPTILEIEGKPAISFIDELLSSSITPEEYPFFLTLGINYGETNGNYDENNFAIRLCQDIDKKRGGIIMFEPDMVAGTKFQIMCCTQEPDYIRSKVENLLHSLKNEGREPLFSIYISCAGRCAGYGGTNVEDAYIIQDVVQNRFPLLGFYTGVEIATIAGRPGSLNWAGVFCVFSKNRNVGKKEKIIRQNRVRDIKTGPANNQTKLSYKQMEKLCVSNMAKILALKARSIVIRNELEQKRRGFSLLAKLSMFSRDAGNQEGDLFLTITKSINAALNMQKTVLLLPNVNGYFIPSILQGYTTEEKAKLTGLQLKIDAEMLDINKVMLVTGAYDESYLAGLRKILKLPYFISTPIIVENKMAGIIIAGRMMEIPPFLPRINENEAEVLQAIAALLASIMIYQKLDEAYHQARIDSLTGLYNREALEQKVTALLKQKPSRDLMSAFILIDLDHFKDINDNHGHITGDRVLKTFAWTLRNSFRSTDIISRFGGDEFIIFCTAVREIGSILYRTEKLVDNWSKTYLYSNTSKTLQPTLSIGISIAPYHGTTYNELLHKADIALYEVKKSGRNGCSIYDTAI